MTGEQDAPGAAAHTPAAQWLRWGQHVLFGVLWAIGAYQTFAERGFGAALVTALVVGAWYPLGAALTDRGRRRWAWPWFAVLVVGWVLLVLQAPAFAWLAFALSLLAMHLLPTGPALGTVAACTLTAVSVLWPTASNPVAAVLGPTVGALVAIGVSGGYRAIDLSLAGE